MFLSSSCTKVKTYYLTDEDKIFNFKSPSYWIYANSIDSTLDTLTVVSNMTKIIAGGSPKKYEEIKSEVLEIILKWSGNNQLFTANFSHLSDASLTENITSKTGLLYYSSDEPQNCATTSPCVNEHFDILKVLDSTYISIQKKEALIPSYYSANIFWSKTIGAVEIDILPPNQKKYYLLKYKIYK